MLVASESHIKLSGVESSRGAVFNVSPRCCCYASSSTCFDHKHRAFYIRHEQHSDSFAICDYRRTSVSITLLGKRCSKYNRFCRTAAKMFSLCSVGACVPSWFLSLPYSSHKNVQLCCFMICFSHLAMKWKRSGNSASQVQRFYGLLYVERFARSCPRHINQLT